MEKQFCKLEFPFNLANVVEHYKTYFGPVQRAFAALDVSEQATYRHGLEDLWTSNNQANDGTTRVFSEYLEIYVTACD